MNRDLAERLSVALTGGLHVEPTGENYGCSIEAAMSHIAAAQLRAIRFAMAAGDPDDGEQEEGRGWCITGKFTRMDALAAIGGVEALLQDAHRLADEIRRALSQPKTESEAIQ